MFWIILIIIHLFSFRSTIVRRKIQHRTLFDYLIVHKFNAHFLEIRLKHWFFFTFSTPYLFWHKSQFNRKHIIFLFQNWNEFPDNFLHIVQPAQFCNLNCWPVVWLVKIWSEDWYLLCMIVWRKENKCPVFLLHFVRKFAS